MRIAKINELNFEIPKDAWFSFFNSPYPAHKFGTAIDVYFSGKALFPFEEGKVLEIRKVRTPQYVPIREDYLTIFQVEGFCLKVLHVKPSLKLEEKIYLGDEIGELVVSGFFRPWSDKHAHFELRDCKDRYRARGGFLIHPKILKLVPTTRGNEFEVVEKTEHYYWLKPLKRGEKNLTPSTFNRSPVEGGLPHYHYGAVFGKLREVELFGIKVPTVQGLLNDVSLFGVDFQIFANEQKVKGIGIYCNQEKIKLIGGEFEVGDVLKIKFLKK
ncbi:hypothetical protein [Thermococcus paralvinellae]|uniref:Peptidase M23 domain-containing protein n=1 Tax=Thermococcus paralvinellae TaxID=582419 RepID=W0I5U1_9EURY|nr:hypothetical protein [Thermococcus paralvinellae]AHF80107.1 Hypothetical protein TES1_0721 [Thermococcus paralvinellae]